MRACRVGATLQPASRPPGGGAGDIQHCPGRAHRPPGRGTSAPSVHVLLRPACRRQVPERVERRTMTQNVSLASRQGKRRLEGSLLCGPSFTQPPGPCGTHTRCPAPGRLGAARANLAVGRGPPGPRSPHRLVCGDRTRPVEQRGRISLGQALPCLPLQAHPHGAACPYRPAWTEETGSSASYSFFFFWPPILAGAKLNSVSAYLRNSIHPLWDEGHCG